MLAGLHAHPVLARRALKWASAGVAKASRLNLARMEVPESACPEPGCSLLPSGCVGGAA